MYVTRVRPSLTLTCSRPWRFWSHRIIGTLDDDRLSTRKAEGRTSVNHADFTRIRNVQLDRFTIDRLMTVLNKLGQRVDA